MAKSKSPKSTAIDILDNSYLFASLQGKLVKHAIACDGCSLRTLGTHSRCRLPQNLYRTYLLKIYLNRIWKEICRTRCRRWRIWGRPRRLRSRQHLLRPSGSPLVRNCKGSPHTGNRHNLRQSHDCHRSRQQKPQRSPSKKLRQPRAGQTRSW